MKVLVGIGGSGLLLGGLYAGDALTAGQVYDIPLAQAYSELSSMPLPSSLVQTTSGTGAASVAVMRSAQVIEWHFQIGGKDVALFTARLSAEGLARTRVRVSYTPGDTLPPELAHLASTSLLRDLARIAMSEQVDAQLEHRPLDQSDVVDSLARHAAAHPEQVREFELAVGDMMKDMRSQIFENSRDLSSDAAQSDSLPPGLNQSAMDAATRPSVVLPVNQ